MNSKFSDGKWSILLGSITLILFATKPYLLDLIEPSKSMGQVLGENVKDLIDSVQGEKENTASNSPREVWSNIIRIVSFCLFTITLFFTARAMPNKKDRWLGIIGGFLAIIGLGLYLSHLILGLIGFIILMIFLLAFFKDS